MNSTTLVETLGPLAGPDRVGIPAQVDRLVRACESDSALQDFEREVLEILRGMFDAEAAGFWFRVGSAGLDRSTSQGFEALPVSESDREALDRAVANRWQSPRPSQRQLAAGGWTVIVGPIRDGRQPLGALQLVIDSHHENASHQHESTGSPGQTEESDPRVPSSAVYVRAVSAVLQCIGPALARRMEDRVIPLPQAEQGLQLLGQQIAGIQRSIRLAIERYLHQFDGATFGSLDANQHFVRQVQRMLDSHGLRVRCPECGYPAILRCSRSAAVADGVFVFDHYLPEGRTFHGGSRTLPLLRTVAKPTRRRSKTT